MTRLVHAVSFNPSYRVGDLLFISSQAAIDNAGKIVGVGNSTYRSGGRFLTLTLWETAEDMHEAREALGPLVDRLLNPLMTAPSKLLGTGRVVVNDLVPSLGKF